MKIQVTNETGRKVNPYRKAAEKGIPSISTPMEHKRYMDFEQSVQSYPAPGFQDTAPGEWVEAEYSYQGYSRSSAKWMDISKDVFDRWNREYEPKIIWKTRQIWKAKAEGESVEQAGSLKQSVISFILEIDSLTTKEFCQKHGLESPSWKGDVATAANEFIHLDALKWKKVKDFAKAKWREENLGPPTNPKP